MGEEKSTAKKGKELAKSILAKAKNERIIHGLKAVAMKKTQKQELFNCHGL